MWQKQGVLVARPDLSTGLLTHAALPSVDVEMGGFSWIYFSSRDDKSRAHICRAPLTIAGGRLSVGPAQIVLRPGELGTFDDAGVTHSCTVRDGDNVLLYYSGWSLGQSVPFYFYVGLAVSSDGGANFERISQAPILERSNIDPFLTASPSVLREGATWRMWYVSGAGWDDLGNGEVRHRYNIKYAESADGVAWQRDGKVALDFTSEAEYAMGRPCVIAHGGQYEMWFCVRGDNYRIELAVSNDGITWERTGEPAGLAPSFEGWDSEMACYPYVFDDGDDRFVLYNGNGYGLSGLGYATNR